MKSLAIAGLVALLATTATAQVVSIEPNGLVVEPENWPNWVYPTGTLSFADSGVKPIFIREQVNAALDAVDFDYGDDLRGGVRDAGSNFADAANVIDGRDDTYWEPDTDAPLEQWWVEVDLGRLVWVRKLVVKFAAEGEGDPFLQFKVLTSKGEEAFLQSEALSYLRVGRSDGLNKSQRIYEFDLMPTRKSDEGVTGDQLQYLQIVATASDFGRAAEVTEAIWRQLGEAVRGDSVFFRRDALGGLREVDAETYDAIERDDQRGPKKFFRREQPRLAEIEVWSAGDNIVLGVLDRGGEIDGYGNLGAEVLVVDGEFTTFWSVEVGFSLNDNQPGFQDPFRDIFLDLGAWYWVNRTALVFGDVYSLSFPNYVITLSDGQRAPNGDFAYVPLAAREDVKEEPGERRSSLFHQSKYELTKARYFKMDYAIIEGSSRPAIREIQLYGRGYLPQVTLESGLIELGRDPRILSRVNWEADTPPGTELQIRTRTGNDIQRHVRYFRKSGAQVADRKAYDKLLSFQRGDSLVSSIPGEDFSNWSKFYPASGSPITSPSPRRYAMIQASLVSEDPDATAELRSLSIDLDAPLASQVLGEVGPRRTANIGVEEVMSLYLKPRVRPGEPGFDQVLIELPAGSSVDLVEVVIGSENDIGTGSGQTLQAGEVTRFQTGSDSLWVRLPVAFNSPSALLALRFTGALFLASNAFAAQVGMGEGDELVWQLVDPGEATALVEGRGMNVFSPLTGGLVGDVDVSPNPFSPNGDGINDQVVFSFPVFKLQGAKPMVLEVYGLDGGLLHREEQPSIHTSGFQQVVWNGRGTDGDLLPPGLYLVRVGVDVDDADDPKVAKVIAIAY